MNGSDGEVQQASVGRGWCKVHASAMTAGVQDVACYICMLQGRSPRAPRRKHADSLEN